MLMPNLKGSTMHSSDGKFTLSWPYQKPKKCWKCGGYKNYVPELGKWRCPQCDKSRTAYPPQQYPTPSYPQSGYGQRQHPIYRGPPTPAYRTPAYGQQYTPTYQVAQSCASAMPAGSKLCIYCGASMREDELICPKCMQRAFMV